MNHVNPHDIAKLINEDPDIINEMGGQGNIGTYIADDVPLSNQVHARIVYEFRYGVSGQHQPASWGYAGGSPAEAPTVDITEVVGVDLDGVYDVNGNELPPSMLPPNYQQVAIQYFWNNCVEEATQELYNQDQQDDQGF